MLCSFRVGSVVNTDAAAAATALLDAANSADVVDTVALVVAEVIDVFIFDITAFNNNVATETLSALATPSLSFSKL